jgi:hypothetical protein
MLFSSRVARTYTLAVRGHAPTPLFPAGGIFEGQGTGSVQGDPGRTAHAQNHGLLVAKVLPIPSALKIEAFAKDDDP